jgi:hypothetical protein
MELEFENHKVTKQQEYWQQKAIELAASQKKDMGLVKNDGSYQVWTLNKCGNNVLFVAKYDGGIKDEL